MVRGLRSVRMAAAGIPRSQPAGALTRMVIGNGLTWVGIGLTMIRGAGPVIITGRGFMTFIMAGFGCQERNGPPRG